MSSGTDDAREGFVLVSVLAVALLFVTVSATLATRSRLFVLQERNRLEAAKLQAIVDGVARIGAFSLGQGKFPLEATGITGQCRQGDTELTVKAVDQDMLLDLNGAPPQMISDVLSATGMGDIDAATLSAQIVDYRDPDDMAQPLYGAERIEYQRAGLTWTPRNDYFADPAEFAQLPAARAEPLNKTAFLLTVYNGRAAIDPAFIYRLYGHSGPIEQKLRRWAVPSRNTRFSLMVEAKSAGRAAATRTAIFTVETDDKRPVFLKWSRDRVDEGRGADTAKPVSEDRFCAWLRAAEAEAR